MSQPDHPSPVGSAAEALWQKLQVKCEHSVDFWPCTTCELAVITTALSDAYRQGLRRGAEVAEQETLEYDLPDGISKRGADKARKIALKLRQEAGDA